MGFRTACDLQDYYIVWPKPWCKHALVSKYFQRWNVQNTYLCGLDSQFKTFSHSVYSFLQGISRWIWAETFGVSALPSKLYSRPFPSGNGKKMRPYFPTNRLEGFDKSWFNFQQTYRKALESLGFTSNFQETHVSQLSIEILTGSAAKTLRNLKIMPKLTVMRIHNKYIIYTSNILSSGSSKFYTEYKENWKNILCSEHQQMMMKTPTCHAKTVTKERTNLHPQNPVWTPFLICTILNAFPIVKHPPFTHNQTNSWFGTLTLIRPYVQISVRSRRWLNLNSRP